MKLYNFVVKYSNIIGIIAVVNIILKLVKVIDWSWWIVLWPLEFCFLVGVIVGIEENAKND